ncbi:MAG: T9SS type A sorting domain-containing protein [Taibaiella sp.]|nr:T9SS type A sorting domain-containing protein [Taibaiella sp.]
MKKLFLLLFFAAGVTLNSNGQGSCTTDIIYNKLKASHPEIAVLEQQLNEELANSIEKGTGRFARTTAITDTVTYDMPIVVHVVHSYGPEYLADSDIYNAVRYWADVYMQRNADTADVILPFKKYIGNARIRLHLATIDPSGNATKGVTHEYSYLTNNAGDEAKLNQWPPNKYMNIWFINQFSSSMAGAAAYAYYPSSAAYFPYYDGIIGLYNYLNYDKAIPHELGHTLDLEHTWGNTNSPAVACGDDGVDDTPPTMGHNPVGCVASALYDVTCAVGYMKTYHAVSGLDSIVDYPDTVNSQNIMDYTYCQKMFTKGQVQRMRAALTSSVAGRNNLYTPANLAATGALAPMPDLPPIAAFSVERPYGGSFAPERGYFLCTNSASQFNFKNRSWNDTIISTSWTFSNGATNPTSSNIGNVYNSFTTPGWVTVSVTATGNNTGTNTYTDNQAVYVADPNAIQPAGYVQDFSSPASISQWPIFNYFKNQFKWELYTGTGYDDNSCIRYRSYDDRSASAKHTGNAQGDYDDIISPAFDLSGVSTGNVNLNFFTAGSYVSATGASQDSLQILLSNTCGTVWHSIAVIKNSALTNNSAQGTEFIPTTKGQWVAHTVTIPPAYHSGTIFVKFRYWPGNNGNNLYLDKFGISPYTTDVNEVAQNHNKINIFPNPSTGDCKMAYVAGSDGKVYYNIKDITGRTIYEKSINSTPGLLSEESISRSVFNSQGIYIITVIIGNNITTQKLIIN